MTAIHSASRPRYPDVMSAADPVTPERRRMSIRLPRPLWIGVAAVLLVVAAVGLRIGIPAYRQAILIREIKQSGGDVLTNPQLPYWLRHRLGDDRSTWFENVELVRLGPSATNENLAQLRILPELQRLDLRGTQVTDASLVHLERFDRLTEVALATTRATDAGVAHLRMLTRLERLSLNANVTDAGLAHLAGLPNLHYLRLDRTQVTDDGLRHLKGLKLRVLWLNDNTQITEAGIANLERAIPGLAVGK